MNDDIDARSGAISQPRRQTARRVRRVPQAVSVGLLVAATVLGVHLGLDGPAVSPVSPVAIAARYGPPPGGAPAPPSEMAAAPPAEPAAPPAAAEVTAAPSTTAAPATATATASAAAIAPSSTDGSTSSTTIAPSTATTAPSAAATTPSVAAATRGGATTRASQIVMAALEHGHERGQHDGGGHE